MVAATGQPRDQLCLACFDGQYPIPLPEEELLGKNFIERALPIKPTDAPRPRDAEGVGVGIAGGAADALNRP